MKRRAFLGLMGGAVAAGPKLAQDIAVAGSSAPPAGQIIGWNTGGVVASGGDWRKDRIETLRGLLAGESQDLRERADDIRLSSAEMRERFRLDALKSVSPASKARMLLEFQVDHSVKQQRNWWQRELDRLLIGN